MLRPKIQSVISCRKQPPKKLVKSASSDLMTSLLHLLLNSFLSGPLLSAPWAQHW